MPRGSLHKLAGHVLHVTDRCHRKQFLLKFARDRRAWLRWLFEARRRYELCVLNYQVTCNHVHLLVFDHGRGEVARSMQLAAGCCGQAYNSRKRRRGAFWEDCYHATAVDTEVYLAHCMAYIDLNMVRAGVVDHPRHWRESGYREIQEGRQRYRIIDRRALSELLGVSEERLASVQNEWVEAALAAGGLDRRPEWSESVAVGRRSYVEDVKNVLGGAARHRRIEDLDDMTVLRDPTEAYAPVSGPKSRR
jgi:putative transposase